MRIHEIGELNLVNLIKQGLTYNNSVVLGIGDDAAAYKPEDERLQLITTDMLIEGIHFDLMTTTAVELGFKALSVNLSDIAAMGGTPRQVVVSLGLPRHFTVEFILDFYKGMGALAKMHDVNIIGGDTVASRTGFVVNITVTGDVHRQFLQHRNTAKPDDIVVVTGTLGDSAAGLHCLREKISGDYVKPLINRHVMPEPRVASGALIARYASSMSDISDGLAIETNEIAATSSLGMIIDSKKLPVSADLYRLAKSYQENLAMDFALYGGEDYELIFTISPDNLARLQQQRLPDPVVPIGVVTDKVKGVYLKKDSEMVALEARGYNHFEDAKNKEE